MRDLLNPKLDYFT